jgi:hypothetical protein
MHIQTLEQVSTQMLCKINSIRSHSRTSSQIMEENDVHQRQSMMNIRDVTFFFYQALPGEIQDWSDKNWANPVNVSESNSSSTIETSLV